MHASFTSPDAGLARAKPATRLTAGIVALLCFGLLFLSATLRPDGRGFGTHKQLGLPACGWVVAFDMPCMTCGMTTSFASMANGNIQRGFIAQPAGALLAIGVAGVFWIALHTALTGSRAMEALLTLVRGPTLWLAAGVLAAAWAYKWITWPT
jgi:hypothetical protein